MSTTNKTWADKVMEFITGGDEAKVKKMHTKTIKFCKTQIGVNEREIENLNDLIEDAVDAKNEAVLNIDVDRIKDTNTINAYIPNFLNSLTHADSNIDELNDQIEEKEEQIKLYNAHIKTLS